MWNRTPGRAEALVAGGARDAATAEEAVADAGTVLLCLVNADAARAVLAKVAPGLGDRIVVDLTNGTPTEAVDTARIVEDAGGRYLSVTALATPPLIGTPRSRILVSGSGSDVRRVRQELESFGEVEHVGEDIGRAAAIDLALLAGMYGLFAGFLHAAAVERAGGESAVELEPRFSGWVSAMLGSLPSLASQIDRGDYEDEVTSPLAMQSWALRNIVRAAQDAGVRPDLLDGFARLAWDAVEAGHGAADVSAVTGLLSE